MTSGRYLIERHGKQWAITDLGHDIRNPRWTHPTQTDAQAHIARLETPPRPRKPAQGNLFDTQEVAH